jgi:hypothetical protein
MARRGEKEAGCLGACWERRAVGEVPWTAGLGDGCELCLAADIGWLTGTSLGTGLNSGTGCRGGARCERDGGAGNCADPKVSAKFRLMLRAGWDSMVWLKVASKSMPVDEDCDRFCVKD